MTEMMDWHTLELYHAEHYRDLLGEVNQARLCRETLTGRERNRGIVLRLMTWLGRRLAAWGRQLQAHSASNDSVRPLPVVSRSR